MLSKETFLIEIARKFRVAESNKLDSIQINAGELHRELGKYPGSDNRMPSCCLAMRNHMQPGDEIVQAPPSGVGASLTIRYKLPRQIIESDNTNTIQSNTVSHSTKDCDSCGISVPINANFCPDCGEKTPDYAESLRSTLSEARFFLGFLMLMYSEKLFWLLLYEFFAEKMFVNNMGNFDLDSYSSFANRFHEYSDIIYTALLLFGLFYVKNKKFKILIFMLVIVQIFITVVKIYN
jgi:predicted RNA-binding Zn-ribbon protein involved in translation (DUF1610 family)